MYICLSIIKFLYSCSKQKKGVQKSLVMEVAEKPQEKEILIKIIDEKTILIILIATTIFSANAQEKQSLVKFSIWIIKSIMGRRNTNSPTNTKFRWQKFCEDAEFKLTKLLVK